MKDVEYQQISCMEVLDPDDDRQIGIARMTVWVEAGRVKVGHVVTFKETGDRRWYVTERFCVTTDKPNRGWGLDLPKSQRTER